MSNMISINLFEEISGLSEQIANTTENGILISLRGRTILSFMSINTMPPPETFLSADEMELMRSFKSEKRRKEWCAGRLSAKRIISAVYGTEMRSMTVSYDEYHRPLCDGYLVSITHSVGLAAAAFSYGKAIGLDLEKTRPHSIAWLNDYFNPDELPEFTNEYGIMAWTRKEAVMKALGLGLTVPAKTINISKKTPGLSGKAMERFLSLGSPELTIGTVKIQGWYCSLVSS